MGKRLSNLDMTLQQIKNLIIDTIAGDPGSPQTGQVWYDSTLQRLGFRGTSTTYKVVRDGGDLTAASVANAALTTNPLARANHTGTQSAATVSDFDTQVNTHSISALAIAAADVNLNTHKLINVVDPSGAQDAATKNYVDALIQGFSWKASVRAGSTVNVTIASALINGLVMDGVTLATGDRVLLKNQTSPAENGIWVVVATGAATRATDSDTATKVLQEATYIQAGTTLADTQWVNTTNAPITLGTTGLVFAQVGGGSGVTAGNGLTGTTSLAVLPDPTPADILVTVAGVKTDPTKIPHIYTNATVGDGASTSIAITHNLGTRAVIVRVFSTSTPWDEVDCDIAHTSTTSITLTFGVAPTASQFTCVVLG